MPEVKAIASGNPAVMEKVKVDTEVRKLDQLRAAHLSQQHSIRMQIRCLPEEISNRRERIERLQADIERRAANTTEEFSMIVGNRTFSGKDARAHGAEALNKVVLSWREDMTLQTRGGIRGFEVLSRGRKAAGLLTDDEESLPELFIRGAGIYKAQLNPENPLGTMQSIEHVLRGLDKALLDERERLQRAEKMLAEFEEQAGKPFAQEARLKELIARQAELNAALDLDKGERQAAPDDPVGNDGPAQRKNGHDRNESRPRSERFVCADEADDVGGRGNCHGVGRTSSGAEVLTSSLQTGRWVFQVLAFMLAGPEDLGVGNGDGQA